MDHTLDQRHLTHPAEQPRVRKVGLSHPFAWLRLGARDLADTPRASLGLGALVAALGLLLMAVTWEATYIAPALLGGFLLVAPFIAIALYGLSRQREQGQAANTAEAWRAWRTNAGSIALFGLMLTLAYIFWERLAAIVFAFFYSGEALHLSRLPAELLLSGQYGGLLFTFVAAGAALAAVDQPCARLRFRLPFPSRPSASSGPSRPNGPLPTAQARCRKAFARVRARMSWCVRTWSA